MSAVGLPPPQHKRSRTIDAKKVRLSILALLVIGSFVALYSRLWYLQVLAVDELKAVAKDNRVRTIEYEPPRGDILDRWGNPLVENKLSLAVSLERELLEDAHKKSVVLVRLARELNLDVVEMFQLLDDATVSPYRPIPVAYDVPEHKTVYIEENPEDFPGVVIEKVWRRKVVRGYMAPHVLGFTNEINSDELKDPEWRGYDPGDIIGKSGVERTYDEVLRGKPRLESMVVDSAGDPIGKPRVIREAEPGLDVRLTIIPRIQRVAQSAIENGVMAARATGYQGRSGAAVVMDPDNGEVLALASYPTYDARILANGYTDRDARTLGVTTEDPSDDALTNRPIAAPLPPGSTFKPLTTAAALELDVVEPYDYIDCPGVFVPEDSHTEFYNWSFPTDLGPMDIPRALEISCNTVFFNLGWRMEDSWGEAGDGQFLFQRYVRNMGFGRSTGLDLPEHPGLVPDPAMCDLEGYCPEGKYVPGYTVNMAVGQGDLLTTPLQMAVGYSALVNGGRVLEPHVVTSLSNPGAFGAEGEVVKEFEPVVRHQLALDETELSVIRQGMYDVVNGSGGTAADAFAGFSSASVAGKTGTAQVGEEEGLSHAWFISYAPAEDPEYVTAVYVEYAGHGGETAAPIAREIYEGIFNRDYDTSVSLHSGAYD